MRKLAKRIASMPFWLGASALFFWAFLSPGLIGAQQNQTEQSQGSSRPANKSAQPGAKPSARNGATSQPAFSSPQDAANALQSAARNHDENALMMILGPGSKDIVLWTDDEDMRKSEIDKFVERYDRMHRLVHEPDDETTLYVGAENWPMPIPIVERNGKWYFDAALGRQEILYRRVGENEMNAVESLHALADAENEYYEQSGDSGGTREYAERFTASDGKRDGLYWPGASESDECPIGQYLAQANYDRPDHKPYDGYYFRILTAQGPKAPGGARNFMADGKMTGGFAFVAFPAVYRSSGVATFIVGGGGRVYEKDLGPMTEQVVKSMKVYNPDQTWTRVRSLTDDGLASPR
jgi:hypothetical protein